ncbi:MAG: hypothetical protein MR609_05360 [Bacteroidales bacterium]|nr:hypothetical protein [Bacteroidales bacterium]
MTHQILYTILVLPTIALGTTLAQNGANPLPKDTLQRELVLEREYVPSTAEVKKDFFNPLDVPKSARKLKPLRFARDTYGVDVSLRPRLFDPVYNSYAQNEDPRNWHLRLYGGYPARLGANIGMHFNAGENGSLDFGIDHDSRKSALSNPLLPFRQEAEMHDTEVSARFSQKLDTRTLGISGSVYHSMETLYGLPSDYAVSAEPSDLRPKYTLFSRIGGEAGFELSPAPLLDLSPWQYSVYLHGGYAALDIPATFFTIPTALLPPDPATPVTPAAPAEELGKVERMSGYDVKAGGTLAYGLKVYNFNFGADVSFEMSGRNTSAALRETGAGNTYGVPMALSGTPFLSYLNDYVELKAGVKVQFLNGVSEKFALAPLVNFRWKAHDLFSIVIDADGGGDLVGFRELYELNRYALTPFGDTPMDVARYRISAGFELGNLYGFSASLKGGYADYAHLFDWYALMSASASRGMGLPAIVFSPVQNENVSLLFFEASARYVSPVGFTVSGGARYDKYTVKGTDRVVSGRPSLTLNVSADYRINPEWSVALALDAKGGIKQRFNFSPNLTSPAPEPSRDFGTDKSSVASVPFVGDLTARVSYDFSKYAGLSLIGTNLLNQHYSEWLGYGRAGAGIMAALTLHF